MIPAKSQFLLLVVSSTLVKATLATSLRKRNSSSRRLENFDECLVLKSVIEYEDTKVAAKNGDKEVCSCLIDDGTVAELTNLGDELCSQMLSSVSKISSNTGFQFNPETQQAEVPVGAALQTTTIEEEDGPEYWGRNRRRRLLTGNQKILIVRAKASDSETTSSEAKLKEEVLGLGGSDLVNLSSQYSACSYGQLTFSASTLGNGGAYTVTINESTAGSDNGVIRNAMNSKWQSDLGSYNSQNDLDYVLLCIPPGTNGGWIAYAYINYWLSVYNNRWCEYPSGLMHEIGHNLGLAHSGEGSNAYADQSGMMGFSYSNDEGPIMCFNGVKTWQLNWFSTYHQPVEFENSYYWQGDLIGFVDRDQAETNDKMIFKLNPKTTNDAYEYYVHFNRQIGFNSGTREGGNRVLIARRERGTAYKQSYLLAKLSSNGSYTISNFGDEGDLTINVGDITLNSQSKSSAKVTIQYGEIAPPTNAPIPPTNAPSPPTNAPVPPTNAPVPPTNSPSPPTNAPVPPTNAPVPPTNAPVPPTNAPVSPTNAPVPPTDAPIPLTNAPVPPTDAPSSAPVVSPINAPIESPVQDEFEIIFKESFDDEEYEMIVKNKVVEGSSTSPTYSGNYSLKLKKKANVTSKNKNIKDYSTLKIDFKYYGKGMENDEYFILESKFNGSPWNEEGRWVKGENFDNNIWNDASVTFDVNGKKKLKFRIKEFANQKNDRIYLDDVVLSGLPE